MKARKPLVITISLVILTLLGCFLFVMLRSPKEVSTNFSAVSNPIPDEEIKINEKGITWPEGQLLPSMAPLASQLDAITTRNREESILFYTLQGLVNRTQPRIFCVGNPAEGKDTWPKSLNIPLVNADKWDVLLKYKNEIKGIVIYDKKKIDTVNLATTIASIKDCIVASPKLAEKLTSEPYNLPIVEDLQDRFKDKFEVYQYLYDHYWSQCNHRIIYGLNPNEHHPLRDYVMASKGAVIWLNAVNEEEKKLAEKFLKDMAPAKSMYLGWWVDEPAGVSLGSTFGVPTLAADWMENATVYSGMPRKIDIPAVPAKPKLENKIYLSFIISDGDNIQYTQHDMRKLWDSPERGKIPIGWTATPLLVDMAPQILNWYHKTATDNDCIIDGPSAAGYTYFHLWEPEPRDEFLKLSEKYMKKSGMTVITPWTQYEKGVGESYARYMPSLWGITSQQSNDGIQIFNNSLPMIALYPAYAMSVKSMEEDFDKAIEKAVNTWDGKSPMFLGMQRQCWGFRISELIKLAEKLDKSKFVIVRPDHQFMLFREANGLPINVARDAKVTASGSAVGKEPINVIDGTADNGKSWTADKEGNSWLMLDLGNKYVISRYVVKHAGMGGEQTSLNTRDFKLQKSDDGKKWVDVDIVKENTSSETDRSITAFKARYVRLYITDAGVDKTARIFDFEVHGTPNERKVVKVSDSSLKHDTGFISNGELAVYPKDTGKSAYVISGIYLDDFTKGTHKVSLQMLVDGSADSNDKVATIEVVDAKTGEVLGAKDIFFREFANMKTYEDKSMVFDNTVEGRKVEVKVMWHNKVFSKYREIAIN